MLLVNAKLSFLELPEGFPIFNGKYSDFSFDWYAKVGMTLQLTMMTQIIVPPIIKIVSSLVPLFKRWKDRGYSSDRRNTQQVLQEEYEELYTGEEFPIEQRYGIILRTFFMTMLLSAGMPTFYFTGFLEMLVMYWTDKYLCKFLPNPYSLA